MGKDDAMNAPFMIRPATPDDVVAVQSMLVEVAHWLLSRGVPQWDPQQFDRSAIASWLDNGVVLLACHDADPVGTVSITWSDRLWADFPGDAGYVHKLAVRRAAAGQGVSLRLLKEVEQVVVAHQRHKVRLDCWAGNVALRRFYTQAGFTLSCVKREHTWHCALFEKVIEP